VPEPDAESTVATQHSKIRVFCKECGEMFTTNLVPTEDTESGYCASRFCVDCGRLKHPALALDTRPVSESHIENWGVQG